jgi:hypothetical protein
VSRPRPEVCVVISVRNGERYLAEAIESVLVQEGVELELRIYDNGSTDASLAIASGFADDPRVTIACNPDGSRYYTSLNRALRETEAPWFAPFASDDVMLPGNLAAKLEALAASGAGLAHSLACVIDEHGSPTRIWARLEEVAPRLEQPAFFWHAAPVNPTILMSAVARTELLRAIGGFDERLDFCSDWLAVLRLALRAPVVTLHAPLIGYRRFEQSGTSGWLKGTSWVGETVDAIALAVEDPAFPEDGRPRIGSLFAGCLRHAALALEAAGHLRAAPTGLSAYACAALCAEAEPAREEHRSLFDRLVRAAGLVAPRLPFEAVARVEPSAEAVQRLVDRCRSLAAARLADRFLLCVDPASLDDAVPLLEAELARGEDVELELAPARSLAPLLAPGRVALAPVGAPELALAERAGVPALPYDQPGALGTPWDRNAERARRAATARR